MQLDQRCRAIVAELGLADEQDVQQVIPLTGGVASDIAMVDLGTRKLCVKFALSKLRVAADWEVPVHRNAAEYAWLTVAARICPDNAVELLGRSEVRHGFAMEYLDPAEVYLWKERLLAETFDPADAGKVADLLGRVHAASAVDGFDRTPFRNRDDFHAIRIDPYLSHTRRAYPDLAPNILALERMLHDGDRVLVHGDASPKNILFRSGAPIILDAECATMGDACFDPAFCLNHLILKAIHLPRSRARLLRQVTAFWRAYAAHVDWEDSAALERRVCALLPVLMLARVDGKSPVEYLTLSAQQQVRGLSIPLVKSPRAELASLVGYLEQALDGDGA